MLLNKILNQLENNKFILIFGIIFLSLLFIASIHFRGGAYLQSESQSFILNYLDNRPVLQKIFDIQKNDWGFYQARELSYFFDMLDANFIKISINFGFPHFYSLIYYLGLVIILFVTAKIVGNFIGLKSPLIVLLLFSLFLTAPAVFFSGIFFRTGKILSSVFLILILYLILQQLSPKNKKLSLLLLPLSFLMSISDRQGHFFLLAITFIFFALWAFTRKKTYKRFFILFLFSSLIALLYDYYLGPSIIKRITGVQPNIIFMRPDFLTYTRQDPRWIISNLWLKLWSFVIDSLLFILDTFSYFLGNTHLFIIVLALVFGFVAIFKSKKKEIFLLLLLSFFLVFIMTFFMLIKQPQMVWPGIRRIYYAFPLNLFILLFSSLAINQFIRFWPKTKVLLVFTLTTMLFLNIISLPNHYQIIRYSVESDEYKVHEYSPRLFHCLKNSSNPESFYRLPKEVENVCSQLRKK